MVLLFVNNASAQNIEEGIFIHHDSNFNQSDFRLTVLLPEKAFSCQISKNSPFVHTWSQRLKLTPEDYLQQLLQALQVQSKHSISQNGSVESENSSENDADERHVFHVEKSSLNWKQYFPDKQIHGKRGAIPLEETDYSAAVWKLLQESIQRHSKAEDEIRELKTQKSDLKKEVDKALSLADDSLRAKEQFQKQNYTKFCALINSKKEKIRQLEDALRSTSGPSSAYDASTSSAPVSSVASAVTQKKRSNITAASPKNSAQIQDIRESDGEYDDDTDVDDVTQYDTDEENAEIKARKELGNAKEKALESVSGRQGVSGTKRRHTEESSQLNKKASFTDSQDDLFNSSVEGASMALLSNIKPREPAPTKVSVTIPVRMSDGLGINRGTTVNEVSNLRGISAASFIAEEQHNVATDEDDPASVVAKVLRKNALIRKTKGIDMPRRVDDFDMHFNSSVNSGVENPHFTRDSDRRNNWAFEMAGETSVGNMFLGGVDLCPSKKDSEDSQFSRSDNDAEDRAGIRKCASIDQRNQDRGKNLSGNEAKLDSVAEGSSLSAGDGSVAKDNSSETNGKLEAEISLVLCHNSASGLVPKYEMDTQLSPALNPASDDSVIILDNDEKDVSLVSLASSPEICNEVQSRQKHREHPRGDEVLASPATCPGKSSEKPFNRHAMSEMIQSSQSDIQQSKRSNERCSSGMRTSRKRTRALELDLTEHNFRSGSVIEEILM